MVAVREQFRRHWCNWQSAVKWQKSNWQSSEFSVIRFIPKCWRNAARCRVMYVVMCYFEQTTSLLCRLIGSGERRFDSLQGCNKSEWRLSQSNVGFLGDSLDVTFHIFLLFPYACWLHLCFLLSNRKCYGSKYNELSSYGFSSTRK